MSVEFKFEWKLKVKLNTHIYMYNPYIHSTVWEYCVGYYCSKLYETMPLSLSPLLYPHELG